MQSCRTGGVFRPENITDACFYEFAWCFSPGSVLVPPLALPTNALVIRLLMSKPRVTCTSEVFTLQLAILDAFFCLLVFGEYINFLLVRSVLELNFISWGLNHVGGPVLLCLLALDSYMAVSRPVLFLQLKKPKFRLSLCLLVDVFTVVCCYLMKNTTHVKRPLVSVLTISASVITFVCNILVLLSLRQTGPNKKEVHPVKRRAFKIVLTSSLLLNLHYLPMVVESILKFSVPQVFSPFSSLTCLTINLMNTSSLFQPLAYLVRAKKLTLMRPCCGRSAV